MTEDIQVLSRYFPEPREIEFFGNRQQHFAFGKSEVVFTPVSVGAQIGLHRHDSAQIGMCSAGSYLMECDGVRETILPLTNACNCKPNSEHGTPLKAEHPYVSLDIKRNDPEPLCSEGQGGYLTAGEKVTFETGFSARTVTGPWFKILFGWLPAHSSIPLLWEGCEVMGIPISGKLQVKVADEERTCDGTRVFFSSPDVQLGVSNPFDEEATVVIALLTL